MERNSRTSQGYKLESQIREAFGRVMYTQTCHDKMVKRLLRNDGWLKIGQIVLSAVTTGTLLVSIVANEKISSIISAAMSTALLILNTLAKNFNFIELANQHQKAADQLWKIREEYVSLLTDFEMLDEGQIINKRDDLQNRTAEVYSNSPRTDAKSYKEAQKALKTQEEQTFSDGEIDVMLPNAIRRSNRDND